MITDRQYIGEFHEYPRDTSLKVATRRDTGEIALIFIVKGHNEPHIFTLGDGEAWEVGSALCQLALLHPSAPVPEGVVRQ